MFPVARQEAGVALIKVSELGPTFRCQGQNDETKPIRYLKQSEQLKYSFSQ